MTRRECRLWIIFLCALAGLAVSQIINCFMDPRPHYMWLVGINVIGIGINVESIKLYLSILKDMQ